MPGALALVVSGGTTVCFVSLHCCSRLRLLLIMCIWLWSAYPCSRSHKDVVIAQLQGVARLYAVLPLPYSVKPVSFVHGKSGVQCARRVAGLAGLAASRPRSAVCSSLLLPARPLDCPPLIPRTESMPGALALVVSGVARPRVVEQNQTVPVGGPQYSYAVLQSAYSQLCCTQSILGYALSTYSAEAGWVPSRSARGRRRSSVLFYRPW